MIEVKQLSVRYPKATSYALSDIDLSFKQGEFICILGKSGAGKSTFIRCLNGLQRPSKGEVSVDGIDISKQNEASLRKVRKQMGMIFQHFNLIPRISVLQNVLTGTFGTRPPLKNLLGLFSKQELEVAKRAIENVELVEQMNRRVEALSGGQKQRVGIARALIQQPTVFLGDEPVASLDPGTANKIFELLIQIHRDHQLLTIINVHDVTLAKQFATRILALRDGALIFDGTPQELTDDIYKKIYD
ncbi:phosphonate ABC transporter ATP-binding protein [Desertibacillus haloalkaliphilus]|uniref:phosphonate ABC transporter ATP-binding protein n=1 Tax=Desertibacillus haloalkaliphilus TaxID=1328930 RepID=UPI001C25C46C|nr:phosphonate ABC transporter ATP-binding protein [Desertibacillus haloalkaliphilus]MBU8907415.1 phosphonate ABC transporter ATP-binding protein [Desertibacillus haloalkaliphilus]